MKKRLVAIILVLCIMVVAVVGCELSAPLTPPHKGSTGGLVDGIDSSDSGSSEAPSIHVEIEYVPVPSVVEGLVYDGESHSCGVPTSEKYTISGVSEAIDAGEYICEVSLKDRFSTRWEDNTTGKKKLVWRIAPQVLTIENVTFEDKVVTQYDGECALKVGGILPEQATVRYWYDGNILPDDYLISVAGVHEITAMIVLKPEYRKNYVLQGTIEMTATLTILPKSRE